VVGDALEAGGAGAVEAVGAAAGLELEAGAHAAAAARVPHQRRAVRTVGVRERLALGRTAAHAADGAAALAQPGHHHQH